MCERVCVGQPEDLVRENPILVELNGLRGTLVPVYSA